MGFLLAACAIVAQAPGRPYLFLSGITAENMEFFGKDAELMNGTYRPLKKSSIHWSLNAKSTSVWYRYMLKKPKATRYELFISFSTASIPMTPWGERIAFSDDSGRTWKDSGGNALAEEITMIEVRRSRQRPAEAAAAA